MSLFSVFILTFYRMTCTLQNKNSACTEVNFSPQIMRGSVLKMSH